MNPLTDESVGDYRLKNEVTEGQSVVVSKKTTIQGFTPEEELNYFVERGDWELVLTSEAFKNRSPEGQVQLIREAVDRRITQLGKSLNYLVNRGAEHHAAAVGVIQRTIELGHGFTSGFRFGQTILSRIKPCPSIQVLLKCKDSE